MQANEIAKYRNQQPFRAFRLYLTNDQTYEVRHPEMIRISPFRLTITLKTNEHGVVLEDVDIAPEHVVSLEPLKQSKAA